MRWRKVSFDAEGAILLKIPRSACKRDVKIAPLEWGKNIMKICPVCKKLINKEFCICNNNKNSTKDIHDYEYKMLFRREKVIINFRLKY